MNVTKVRLTGRTALELPIIGAKPTDRFVVRNVDFGPIQVAVSKGDIPSGGSVPQGRRPEDMAIVITIGLNADYANNVMTSDLRRVIYGMITPGPTGRVMFDVMDGPTVVCQIVGTVSKMENDKFSKDPQVILSLDTNSPYLTAPAATHFALPAQNSGAFVIDMPGDAPAGMVMSAVFNQNTSAFQVTNTTTQEVMQFVYDFKTNDVLQVSTVIGNRYAQIIRQGDPISILDGITNGTEWFQLYPGVQSFLYYPEDVVNFTDIYATANYWGI